MSKGFLLRLGKGPVAANPMEYFSPCPLRLFACCGVAAWQVPLQSAEEDAPLALDDPWWVKLFG